MNKRIYPTGGLAAAALGAGIVLGGSASADQQILDDLIVVGSLCTGQDCVNGENFGFDTLRLKENNLRLHFQDTSNSSSFPTTDWRLIANDSSNGGASYFAIEDATAGRIPFRVEANAPANTLYVEGDGDVGIKTANPAVDLHVVEGNTPTLRLEQDGSDGFTPQTWDLAGNEANFFIRDATNGSRLIFRIEPGGPESSVHIDNTGRVGFGTSNPQYPMHLRGSGGSAELAIEEVNGTTNARTLLRLLNNGGSIIRMENSATGDRWVLSHENGAPNRFLISVNGGDSELILDQNGNLEILGTLTTSGSCATPCDLMFDPETEILPIAARAAQMYDLGYLPNVGPTPEAGQYDLTHKVLGMLNELEHAHIYIAQLNDRIEVLETALADQTD